jgi:tRNA(His) 5'-end guanylyltransferase
MKRDDFGNRMKAFESVYTDVRIPIELPMMVRVDGKGFSKFTKGFNKPFDDDLSGAMIAMMLHPNSARPSEELSCDG